MWLQVELMLCVFCERYVLHQLRISCSIHTALLMHPIILCVHIAGNVS